MDRSSSGIGRGGGNIGLGNREEKSPWEITSSFLKALLFSDTTKKSVEKGGGDISM